jgi:nucleoid-associated protein YgaU
MKQKVFGRSLARRVSAIVLGLVMLLSVSGVLYGFEDRIPGGGGGITFVPGSGTTPPIAPFAVNYTAYEARSGAQPIGWAIISAEPIEIGERTDFETGSIAPLYTVPIGTVIHLQNNPQNDNTFGRGRPFHSIALFGVNPWPEIFEVGMYDVYTLKFEETGTYLLSGFRDFSGYTAAAFRVVEGEAQPAPTPNVPVATTPAPTVAPTSAPTATPVVSVATPTPAPVVVVTNAPSGLRTTERIVNVVLPAPVAGQDLRYTVQAGETWWSIAYNYYGSMGSVAVGRLTSANSGVTLQAGTIITIPSQGIRDPITRTHLENAAGMYLVQAGDTLWSIAQRYYGNGVEWGRIFEANRQRMAASNVLYAGQWIVIPNR